jgi:rare lipoprotein A
LFYNVERDTVTGFIRGVSPGAASAAAVSRSFRSVLTATGVYPLHFGNTAVDTTGMWSILAPAMVALFSLLPLVPVVANGNLDGADRMPSAAPVGPPPHRMCGPRRIAPRSLPMQTVPVGDGAAIASGRTESSEISTAVSVESAPESPAPSESYRGHQVSGLASWYGGKFQGRLTANGETFDTNELTAAHRTLPFNTIVRVIPVGGEQSVVVRINDRGPFVDDRVIDLSRAAADIIGITAAGVAPVVLEILHYQEETDLRTIQIASFSRLASATAVAEGLRENGLPAAIETVASAGVHRVIVQGVREREISMYRERLRDLGYPTILVRNK